MKFRGLFLLFISLFFSTLASAQEKKTYLVANIADDIMSHIIFDTMSEQYDITIEYVEFNTFNDAMQAVESGYIDFMGNVIYTDERNQRFEISQPTNSEFNYLYTLHAPKLSKINTIAVPKGTLYGKYVLERFPNVEIVYYETFSQAQQLLLSGQVDGAVDGISRLKEMSTNGFYAHYLDSTYLAISPVSIIAPKGRHIELLKKMEKYAQDPIFQKKLLTKVSDYQKNLRILYLRQAVFNSGLNVAKPLDVKLKSFNNFVHYKQDGNIDGIAAEVLNEVCYILQLNCRISTQESDQWADMFAAFKQGKGDVISPINITRERKDEMYFSYPYYRQEVIVLKRKGYHNHAYKTLAEMFVERIAIVKSNFLTSMLAEMFPEKQIAQFKNEEELVAALINKDIDYALVPRLVFNDIVRESNNTLPIVEDTFLGTVYRYDVAFAFQPNQQGEILHRLFNKAMGLVDLDSITSKYNYVPDWHANVKTQQEINTISWFGFIVVSAVLLWAIIFFYNKSNLDALTGLRNRLALNRKYQKSFPKHKALVYLDINKFKFINDNYGHAMGDKALTTLSALIKKRWQGESYRIGGDEFILVCDTRHSNCNDMLVSMSKFTLYDRQSSLEHSVTLSLGVVQNLEENRPLDDVLQLADKQMYQFKTKQR